MKKHHAGTILMLLFFLAGALVFLYPTISDWIAQKTSRVEIEQYNAVVSDMTDAQSAKMLEQTQEYNEKLSGSAIADPFSDLSENTDSNNYDSLLDMSNGIMAYIEIPSINVYLPIYHGTDSETLEKGAGHIQGTSFPVGGKGTHAVIAGHTGLPGKMLFTNLEQLQNGDTFIIHVLGKELTYQVDQILVVEPDDTSALQIDSNKDYVTLLTCTPYGVNTHRLLVRGVRVEDAQKTDTVSGTSHTSHLHFVISTLFLLVFLAGIHHFRNKFLIGGKHYET